MQIMQSGHEQALMQRMQSSSTFEHIKALSVSPRVSGTDGYAKAVDYVVSQMQQLAGDGWSVKVVEHAQRWGRDPLRNIVAERRGTASDAERGVVLAGAHLDSVRGAPGANDDASGSAILIEMAKAFKGIDTRNDIRLLWFDGEENGLLGSRAYVRDFADDMHRAVAMLNMDMVGSIHGDVGFGVGMRTSNALSDAMRGVALRNGITAVARTERHSRSDHASFDAVGVPSLDFGVSVAGLEREDPYYHSPQDTIDKINLDVLEGYGDLIATGLLNFANQARQA